ncbi:MAG: hypothetical protein IJP88_03965, partial [Synergistaceae bacterium]|nr:hypothetical protein [Synergistaceae bacterium]
LCCGCVYSPYCSVCPVINYALEHDLISRDEHNYKCVIAKGILEYLFKIIKRNDPAEIDILKLWTAQN